MGEPILIIDDDPQFSQVLKDTLELDDLSVFCEESPDAGLKTLVKTKAKVLILDYDLPGMNGFEVLRKIRNDDSLSELLIMMLTVKGDEPHKIRGLETGADDYVAKTTSLVEIRARVSALLRRANMGPKSDLLSAGSIKLDLTAHSASIDGKPLSLTRGEFDILTALVRRPGAALSYETLAASLTTSKEGTSEAVYVHVNHLRRKLGGKGGKLIENVHGIGYKLAL